MSFPPAFLDEIRNRLPLSGIAGSRLRLIRAGREYKGCCPFHHEKTPSFYVNDDKQFFHCFGCGAHGDVIGFTMRYDRLSFPEAVESLAAQAGLQVPRDTPMEREKFDAEKRLLHLLDRATAWFEEQLFTTGGRDALTYLRKRGLSDDAIRRFRLGYAPQDGQSLLQKMIGEGYTLDEMASVGLAKKSDERQDYYSFFRHRVIFPVGDRRGRTVAFGARILGVGEPKYLNSPDHALFHKGKLLYGLSRARAAVAQGQPIIVVEGYMDVIALVEAGYNGAVAPLGTSLTDDQIQMLWKLLPAPENRDGGRDYSPILCFDGDNAGIRAAARAVERALPLLTSAQTLRVATMSGAKDPDELIRQAGKGAFDALLKQAQPMIDVLWNLTLAGRSMRTPEERGAFKDALRLQVGQIRDESLRRLYQDEFKKRADAAFGWKPQNFGQKGWQKSAQAEAFFGARRLPQNKQKLIGRMLLALIINHPALFDEFGENFAQLEFQAPEHQALRQRVIDILSQSEQTLTADELRRALADQGDDNPFAENLGAVLGDILSPDIYTHAKAARADAPFADARKTWLDIWDAMQREGTAADYNAAVAAYRENQSDDNKARLDALKARMMEWDSHLAQELAQGLE